MQKKDLLQYADLEREIKSLEKKIDNLQKNKVKDRVKASNLDFPYQEIISLAFFKGVIE